MSRYNRHIILSEIGQVGQDKISNTKILVIGAGGLGCPVLQYLTAAGVGTIGIIDFDVVELSNLQRQVLFGKSSLGKNKAVAAKARLKDLNDDISIIAYPEQLNYRNAIELFLQYDIIVDGSDNFETRYLVNDACIITNKPLVFGAIYKFEGQVSVFNYKNGPSYRCLFPNPPQKDAVPNCSEIGVLGVLPGIIGSMLANEVLKIILGIGNVLSGKLLCYNALTSQISTLKIKRNETVIQLVLDKEHSFEKKQINIGCEIEVIEVSISEIVSEKNIQFIDIRESHEQPKVDNLNVTYIPLSELETSLHKIDLSKKKALFCKSGMRSKHAVKVLQGLNINNCFSIPQGASEIKNYIKTHNKTVSNAK
ncbi:MAG: molybdopterin-synthase adenylyltransferase MoeB [Flavobacteriaceae bacterium]